jgi:hypothetical protein
MWLSCSAFFHQYMRVYGLATFGQKYDKTGALIRQCESLSRARATTASPGSQTLLTRDARLPRAGQV